ncbi:hypothetical protein CC205_26750 [Pseudomonas savastanoi pv. nerii]|uniref:Uncharacterized protein n=1 Tax=Pseudomonas savastanoi pv. nerii TaxID=360921 RepID=A0AB73Q843_PSESS|nr:hypothetical protein [Pseudomonas savastanoi]PAB25206.1 hypothetical protein CC205_26750 [Pseudomonas savastanoi pv. nerii]
MKIGTLILRALLNNDDSLHLLAHQYSPEEIGNYSKSHRIVGPVTKLFMDHNSSLDHAPLRFLYDEMLIEYTERQSFFIKLTDLLFEEKAADCSLLILKGNTLHWLTDDPYMIRYTADYDLLSDDISNFKDLAKLLGLPYIDTPYAHEDGNIQLPEIELDIHKYFPMYSLGFSETVSPPHNSVQKSNDTLKKLLFSCAEREKFKRAFGNIYVCKPELAALVVISHMYIDFAKLYSPFSSDRPRIRIHEIYEAYQLIQHCDFNLDIFKKFVLQYELSEPLNFYLSVIDSLGVGAPSNLKVEQRNNLKQSIEAPFCLWPGIGCVIGLDADDLISAPIGYNKILSFLSPGPVGFLSELSELSEKLVVDTTTADSIYSTGKGFDFKTTFLFSDKNIHVTCEVLEKISLASVGESIVNAGFFIGDSSVIVSKTMTGYSWSVYNGTIENRKITKNIISFTLNFDLQKFKGEYSNVGVCISKADAGDNQGSEMAKVVLFSVTWKYFSGK